MVFQFLYAIDPNTLILSLLFLIFFAFINWILMKNLNNQATSAIISFSISGLIIYGFFRINYDFASLFFNLGLSQDLLYTVVPILILLGLIFLIRRVGFRKTLMIIGAILVGFSLTDLVYEKGLLLAIGIGLIILGFLLGLKKPKIPKVNLKKNKNKENNVTIVNQIPEQKQEKQTVVEQKVVERKRNLYDLKQKYMAYLFQYYQQRNNPQVQKRMKQAMQTIIKMAKRLGSSKTRFLSKEIGGQKAKAPEDLK